MNYCFISQNNNNFRFRIHYKAGGFFQEGGVSSGQGDEELLRRTWNKGKGQACPPVSSYSGVCTGCLLLQTSKRAKVLELPI